MKRTDSIVVDLLRDFLVAHEALDGLVAAHDQDRLEFEDVVVWAGDDASSVLFRLKEHCHTLLRADGPPDAGEIGSAELLDLVVGSLFHEAMKLRENLYQVEAYARRFEKLRARARTTHAESLSELEHLLELSGRHLHEAFYEARSLMQLARRHVRGLLIEYASSGLVARCLYEHAEAVERVFAPGEVDPADGIRPALVDELYGGQAQAALRVARSYLESAYFDEALEVLELAAEGGADPDEIGGLIFYARGMRAFMKGAYRESVDALGHWIDHGEAGGAPGEARYAAAAMARMHKLAEGDDAPELIARARQLCDALQACAGGGV
jgi:hypothetical protein